MALYLLSLLHELRKLQEHRLDLHPLISVSHEAIVTRSLRVGAHVATTHVTLLSIFS